MKVFSRYIFHLKEKERYKLQLRYKLHLQSCIGLVVIQISDVTSQTPEAISLPMGSYNVEL